MAILDSPTYPRITSTTGAERLVTVKDGKEVGLPVNGILGLLPGDVATISGTTATIATRLVVCTNTGAVTLTLPPASGPLRSVTVMKASSTSSVTINRAGSDLLVSGGFVNATSVVAATGLVVELLSDGTTWYHVSNDA